MLFGRNVFAIISRFPV